MIHLRPSTARGHADHGWLDARHTFSFADYRDPDHMGFSVLRVLNQDRVAPGQGFPPHGHRDMEIVTYVLEGLLEHEDSLGNGSQIRPGEVQVMSAGSGVTHSEYNASREEPLHLLQMWVFPRRRGTEPRYGQRAFGEDERRGKLLRVVSPSGERTAKDALTIDQDASLHVGLLDAGERASHELAPGRCAWLHVARGRMRLNGKELGPGDGAGIREERGLELEGLDGAEVVLWDLPDVEAGG